MISRLARFSVKPEELETCLSAIRTFVTAVREKEARTLRYDSYQLPDKVSFLHVMEFADGAAEEWHRETPHVETFVRTLYPRCAAAPEFLDVAAVAPDH